MQRLLDHFRPALDILTIPESPQPLPAERPERGALKVSSYRNERLWFHPTQAPASLMTDDGRPFLPDDAIACVQFEHYMTVEEAALPTWPADDSLERLLRLFLVAWMRHAGVERVPFIGFWPQGKSWAWTLTHNVGSAIGYAHLDGLAHAEEERGLASAWYFVPERFAWEASRLEDLRQRGHELGVHGLDASGKLFGSRKQFDKRRDSINGYGRHWRASGFRSPSTYRHPFWLTELDFDYDSSYLDVATFEPQKGGVCAPFPFMLNERMVELPVTLPLDRTLRNVLRRRDVVDACCFKAEWIRARHGLATALFHPECNTEVGHVAQYAAVLDALRGCGDGWFARPAQVADWWQRRRASRVEVHDAGVRIEGPAAQDGCVWWAERVGEALEISTS